MKRNIFILIDNNAGVVHWCVKISTENSYAKEGNWVRLHRVEMRGRRQMSTSFPPRHIKMRSRCKIWAEFGMQTGGK